MIHRLLYICCDGITPPESTTDIELGDVRRICNQVVSSIRHPSSSPRSLELACSAIVRVNSFLRQNVARACSAPSARHIRPSIDEPASIRIPRRPPDTVYIIRMVQNLDRKRVSKTNLDHACARQVSSRRRLRWLYHRAERRYIA